MTGDDERPVRLVLDRSALLAYVSGSVHVAEPIYEVTQDRVRFGVTAVSVAETLAMVGDSKDRQLLHRLLNLAACAVLDTTGWTWQELSYWRGVTGRVDLASTVMACLEHRAPILTGESRYGDDLPVTYLPE
ncbi:hypothetical protein O7623_21455 [Solwaraspora sp. WMMD791]|uniref:hypothetical protein n=1 Tax=Solwaraspora sp. WMMD791 TaxID=3016086 RepID=UPI00249A293D|nr:hypothetical protein [Solwaraspora sp. WMMD791]WFE25914.1 hypothetical protein O7623_21455 [Solwaraspora sp. WMMD791]